MKKDNGKNKLNMTTNEFQEKIKSIGSKLPEKEKGLISIFFDIRNGFASSLNTSEFLEMSDEEFILKYLWKTSFHTHFGKMRYDKLLETLPKRPEKKGKIGLFGKPDKKYQEYLEEMKKYNEIIRKAFEKEGYDRAYDKENEARMYELAAIDNLMRHFKEWAEEALRMVTLYEKYSEILNDKDNKDYHFAKHFVEGNPYTNHKCRDALQSKEGLKEYFKEKMGRGIVVSDTVFNAKFSEFTESAEYYAAIEKFKETEEKTKARKQRETEEKKRELAKLIKPYKEKMIAKLKEERPLFADYITNVKVSAPGLISNVNSDKEEDWVNFFMEKYENIEDVNKEEKIPYHIAPADELENTIPSLKEISLRYEISEDMIKKIGRRRVEGDAILDFIKIPDRYHYEYYPIDENGNEFPVPEPSVQKSQKPAPSSSFLDEIFGTSRKTESDTE